jgi:hypothetical protein
MEEELTCPFMFQSLLALVEFPMGVLRNKFERQCRSSIYLFSIITITKCVRRLFTCKPCCFDLITLILIRQDQFRDCSVTNLKPTLTMVSLSTSVADKLSKLTDIIRLSIYSCGARGDAVVEALRYKPEGRGIDSRWCHWNFSLT